MGMENFMSGIVPTMDLNNNRNDYEGGWWIWIIILMLFGWNRNGFGNGYGQEALFSDEFIKRDIFNTNQNVSNTACQTQRDVLENRFASQQCCCETQKEILENRYTTSLGFKDQLYAQQQCCCETNRNIDAVRFENAKNTCDIVTAVNAQGEMTRSLVRDLDAQRTIGMLRDKLEDRDRELMTANFQLSQQAQTANIVSTLQPVARPAYLTCSPYFAQNYGCGCGCGCNQSNF